MTNTARTSSFDKLGTEARAFIEGIDGVIIGGKWVAPGGAPFDSIDPSTGAHVLELHETSVDVVDQAVRNAHDAFVGEWGSMLPAQRELILNRFADLIEKHAQELAEYDAIEGGKPVEQVRTVDIPLAIEQFRYFAGWPTKLTGATIPVSSPDTHVFTRRVPLGVVAAITPWNFPLCQAAIKLAPALAAGNAVVLKPSELTSLSSLRLAQLGLEAGLPAGTLNVITGTGQATGQALVEHPLVQKISFTGSNRVGRHLGALAGDRLIPASLELGGKNPNVIFADADIPKAAAYAATTAWFYSGQVCFAGSRLLVERSALDQVLAALRDHAANLQIGAGLDTATTMGPLSSAAHLAKVEGFLEGARRDGGEIAIGGGRPAGIEGDGYFLEPTAVVHPSDSDEIVREEVFGPVVTVQVFDDEAEAIERANAGEYGLTAGVWTRDLSRAHRVSRAIEAGTVWVNTYTDYNAAAAFGGAKGSGLGRDCGPEGLDAYLETRTTWMSIA